MDFEWDEAKNAENQTKHGMSFEEATPIFDGPILTKIDDREEYGEMREISMGMLPQVFYDYLATTFEGH